MFQQLERTSCADVPGSILMKVLRDLNIDRVPYYVEPVPGKDVFIVVVPKRHLESLYLVLMPALVNDGLMRVFDNGGEAKGGTLDRFTVLFMHRPERGNQVEALGMNTDPFSGIGMHTTADPKAKLGRRIQHLELNLDCKMFVKQALIVFDSDYALPVRIKRNPQPVVLEGSN